VIIDWCCSNKFVFLHVYNLKDKWAFFAGDACTGDVVMFEQNVYEM
jgi:hypothetical protein